MNTVHAKKKSATSKKPTKAAQAATLISPEPDTVRNLDDGEGGDAARSGKYPIFPPLASAAMVCDCIDEITVAKVAASVADSELSTRVGFSPLRTTLERVSMRMVQSTDAVFKGYKLTDAVATRMRRIQMLAKELHLVAMAAEFFGDDELSREYLPAVLDDICERLNDVGDVPFSELSDASDEHGVQP
jgi:DNA-binding ferritin-like protein